MSERNLITATREVFRNPGKGTHCRLCGRDVDDGRAKYCSDYCRSIVRAVMGFLNWTSVRRRIIRRDGEECVECGYSPEIERRGERHIEAIIEANTPEKPEEEGFGVERYLDLSEEEKEAYHDQLEAWREKRDELHDRYGDPRFMDRTRRLEVDHITPISEGGHPFDPANLQTLCSDCHEAKTAEENSGVGAEGELGRPDVEAVLMDYVTD